MPYNRKVPYYLFILSVLITLSGCGGKGSVDTEESESRSNRLVASMSAGKSSEKKQEVVYVYKGSELRDPFVSLTADKKPVATLDGASVAGEMSIDALKLQGLMLSGPQSFALFQSLDGTAYVAQTGKLFDDRGRTVKGVKVVISSDKIVLANGALKKEFKISELREESE